MISKFNLPVTKVATDFLSFFLIASVPVLGADSSAKFKGK